MLFRPGSRSAPRADGARFPPQTLVRATKLFFCTLHSKKTIATKPKASVRNPNNTHKMSSFCSGSSGSGALTQLIAHGALDAVLTGGATTTFWKSSFKRHTNFAMEALCQPMSSAVAFGAESQITLNRSGDMVFYTYVVVDLPGIVACDTTKENCSGIVPGNQFPAAMEYSCAPCQRNDEAALADYLEDGYTEDSPEGKAKRLKEAKDKWLKQTYGAAASLECFDDANEDCPDAICPELGNVWAHWTNDVGHALVKCARLVIGGSQIDAIFGEFMYMWEELSGRAGRRLTEMVGRRWTRAQLINDSRQKRTLYIPLPFYYTQHSGSALPLASLQFHGVQLMIQFEELSKLIVVSGPQVTVKNASTACCLTHNDLSAYIECTYVFLDNSERDRFSSTAFESLCIQHQSFHLQSTGAQVRCNLQFNHPTIELIFAVRRQCNERCNSHFNFSGLDGRDPVVSASLYLNNQARFANRSGAYLRMIQPYQHHQNIPDCFIYCYSFALNPESEAPSGSCNLSRIDHCDLTLTLQDGLGKEQVTVICYARSWNLMRFKEGLGGVAYAS